MNQIKVLITGATGMIGEGVLYECLHHPEVEEVLVITRKTCGYTHPKLNEIIFPDLGNITSLSNRIKGYNACYFCLGVTVLGKNEAEYTGLT